MSVYGVDISQVVGAICGSAWIVLYIAIIWFVWKWKPTTLVGRRWKAAWLIGGLPSLGMPFLIPITIALIVLGTEMFQGDLTDLKVSAFISLFYENLLSRIVASLSLIACTVPFSIIMAFGATYGVYHDFRVRLDHGLDKIVPPSKDEKPNSIIWE